MLSHEDIASAAERLYSAVLSDTLTGKPYGIMNRGARLDKAVTRFQPDIVIANVGAHIAYDNKKDKSFHQLVQEILSTVEELQKEHPFVFVWKTQQPGGCTTDIIHPNNPIKAAQESSFGAYNHARFYARDLYVLSLLQARGIPYLDMRMLYSRSDAHVSSSGQQVQVGMQMRVDCLHLCAPGPLDVIGPLFHKLLLDIGS